MVREMSLIRGLGAPAKERSFPHHLAFFKDHPCLLLPTVSRYFPLFPAKKMSQALVALQYGRGSRAPGRVPRTAPGQPGCTAEQTNHEPRPFLPCGASQREFRGFHETRVTSHESRPLCFSRITSHESRPLCFSRITRHETRPFLLEIPAMCTKSRFLQENTRSAAFTATPVALRAGPVAADANGHATPASAAKSPLIRVDSCPFVVNEPMMRRMKGERSISRQNAWI